MYLCLQWLFGIETTQGLTQVRCFLSGDMEAIAFPSGLSSCRDSKGIHVVKGPQVCIVTAAALQQLFREVVIDTRNAVSECVMMQIDLF